MIYIYPAPSSCIIIFHHNNNRLKSRINIALSYMWAFLPWINAAWIRTKLFMSYSHAPLPSVSAFIAIIASFISRC